MFLDRSQDLPNNLVKYFNETGESLALGSLLVHDVQWDETVPNKNTKALISGNPEHSLKGQRWIWFNRIDFTRWIREYEVDTEGNTVANLGYHWIPDPGDRGMIGGIELAFEDYEVGKTVRVKIEDDRLPQELTGSTNVLFYITGFELVDGYNDHRKIYLDVEPKHGIFMVLGPDKKPLRKATIEIDWGA